VSLGLYLYALRAATPRQLERRLTRPVRRRLLPRSAEASAVAPLPENEALWRSLAFAPRRPGNPSGLLAAFTAAYGEDVLVAARDGQAGDAAALVERFLDGAPPSVGVSWHPYVLSTRVANWLAAATLEPSLRTARAGESIRRQLTYLRRNVEDDILGNHVVRNAKALVLGGLATGDEAARTQGLRLLARELPVQVLPDGGHYERSPAYHRLVLRDLLELAPYVDVAEVVERMRSFASASSRPDGEPALFNDGGLDIAPALELEPPTEGLDVRRETGYAFLRRGEVWLAFDCGAPGPTFLPAHAHADALSFQLWVDGRPLVVDPGTSTYEATQQRRFERGTAAHSTVAANGDQFVVWGSHRSGALPAVSLLEASPDTLVGEARLASGVRHRRTLRLQAKGLEVDDVLTGPGTLQVVSSLPIDDPALSVEAAGGEASSEPRTIAERFGERREARAFVVRARVERTFEAGWRLGWGYSGRSA
jgi:hypothetical protein